MREFRQAFSCKACLENSREKALPWYRWSAWGVGNHRTAMHRCCRVAYAASYRLKPVVSPEHTFICRLRAEHKMVHFVQKSIYFIIINAFTYIIKTNSRKQQFKSDKTEETSLTATAHNGSKVGTQYSRGGFCLQYNNSQLNKTTMKLNSCNRGIKENVQGAHAHCTLAMWL